MSVEGDVRGLHDAFRRNAMRLDPSLARALRSSAPGAMARSGGIRILVRGDEPFLKGDLSDILRRGVKLLSCAGKTAHLLAPYRALSVELIDQLASLKSVAQIKAGQPIRRADAPGHALPSGDAPAAAACAQPLPDMEGRGVVVGIVDYGCDLLHPSLRKSDGSTRVAALWDQRGHGRPPGDQSNPAFPLAVFNYGRELDADEINQALQTYGVDKDRDAFYDVTSDPHFGYFDPTQLGDGCHGTQVASIAAGSAAETPFGAFRGLASEADIIFVNLGVDVDDWQQDDLTPNWSEFGDNGSLVDAIKYVVSRAMRARAEGLEVNGVVINLSLGTWAGAHDGLSIVERSIDEVVEALDALGDDAPMVAVVVAAGNSARLDGHGEGEIAPGGAGETLWLVEPGHPSATELELWYVGETAPAVTVTAPAALGSVKTRLPPGTTRVISCGGREVAIATHVAADQGRPGQIDIVVDPRRYDVKPDTDVGPWVIKLKAAKDATRPLRYHCWIEREETVDTASSLMATSARCTLASLTCGERAIVVGAHAGGDPGSDGSHEPFWPSSNGPKPWLVDQTPSIPHVSAPGARILCAKSRCPDFTDTPSGSSMAAAHASGAVALIMQAAHAQGRRLSADALRGVLIQAAAQRKIAEGGDPANQWDPAQGYGTIDLKGCIDMVTRTYAA